MYIYTVIVHLQNHFTYLDIFTKTNVRGFWDKPCKINHYLYFRRLFICWYGCSNKHIILYYEYSKDVFSTLFKSHFLHYLKIKTTILQPNRFQGFKSKGLPHPSRYVALENIPLTTFVRDVLQYSSYSIFL